MRGLQRVRRHAVAWGLLAPAELRIGGKGLARAATGLVAGNAILGAYQWWHFLIHTPYLPRDSYSRSIWRSRRAHSHKGEHHRFGATSSGGDELLGTGLTRRASRTRKPCKRWECRATLTLHFRNSPLEVSRLSTADGNICS